jgi:tellurite resistance protein TerC
VNVSLTVWLLTVAGLCVLVAADFFIGRKPHDVSIREAGIWTAVWVVLACLFGVGLLVAAGGAPAGEFFAGYITEKSLSVDNLFVFVLIMAKFAVPSQYQQRVLMVGVIVALVLRAAFIAAGAAIISAFSWVFYIFGAFLIWTAWKLVQDARKGGHDEEYEENKLLKSIEHRFGVADRYHGTRLWIEENGKRVMTPMLVVMLAIGSTDVLFALDSIPAIYGLTQDPYIVFTANAFALMGLRQLYFLIGGLLKKLVHLSYGLSIILGFIGVKLVLHALHESGVHVPEISIPFSLGFIVLVLAVTTVTSLVARGSGTCDPRLLDGPAHAADPRAVDRADTRGLPVLPGRQRHPLAGHVRRPSADHLGAEGDGPVGVVAAAGDAVVRIVVVHPAVAVHAGRGRGGLGGDGEAGGREGQGRDGGGQARGDEVLRAAHAYSREVVVRLGLRDQSTGRRLPREPRRCQGRPPRVRPLRRAPGSPPRRACASAARRGGPAARDDAGAVAVDDAGLQRAAGAPGPQGAARRGGVRGQYLEGLGTVGPPAVRAGDTGRAGHGFSSCVCRGAWGGTSDGPVRGA